LPPAPAKAEGAGFSLAQFLNQTLTKSGSDLLPQFVTNREALLNLKLHSSKNPALTQFQPGVGGGMTLVKSLPDTSRSARLFRNDESRWREKLLNTFSLRSTNKK